MAQIVYRVSGRDDAGKRAQGTFRNTDEGRAAARTFARTLRTTRTAYDVRTRVGGRVVTRTFNRRKDADAYASTIEADKLRGTVVDPERARITVKEYDNAWLSRRHDLAESTAELYRSLFDRHIEPTFGAVRLGTLSPSDVRTWNAKLSMAHPSTAAKAYRLLSTMMRTAVTDSVIGRNPCQVKGAGTEKSPERPVASVVDVQALADAMPDGLRLAVLLAAWCQLRRGEVLGLRRRDVDVKGGTISVEVTRTSLMSGRELEKVAKTEAGRRVIAVPPNVVPEIDRHFEVRVGVGPDAQVLDVFVRVLDFWWRKARVKSGWAGLRFHDLRHAGLTWSVGTGASVAELMHQAVHASPVVALRYQHATKERDRALADALGDLAPGDDTDGKFQASRNARRIGRPSERPIGTERGGSSGAGDGDRTRVTSLEGWGSTTELHPRGGPR